jgi:hypothetical protein
MRLVTSQPRRWAFSSRWALGIGHWALIVAAAAAAACGKKGPPLAPIVHIPAAVEQIDARRRGTDVIVTMTVPAKNIDGTVPVDIGRIEVYGYTGTSAPPRGRFLEVGTLVGTVTVDTPAADDKAAATPAVKPGVPIPGGTVSITETLTPDALVAKPIPVAATPARRPTPPTPLAATTVAADAGPLRRFYFALPFSPRGRPGPPGTVAELRLTVLPDPPLNVRATNVADAVVLEWEPSGGVVGFILDRALTPELSPLDTPVPETSSSIASSASLPGPTRYNVYRETAPSDLDPLPAPAEPLATLVNSVPLDALTIVDPLTGLDGRERCYVVRSVRGDGAAAVEGDPSSRECVVPLDDFPPQPPSGLSTVSAEGAITLIWEPSAEPDVAGYLVLRGEAGDATLAPVTDTIATEARYIDRSVRPGVRYIYAVQTIDTRLPRPNVSAESARVEETAR